MELNGFQIHILTREHQCRRHRKKRINKKWRKRYGVIECDLMPHGQVVVTKEGVIYMTKRTFESLRESITGRAKHDTTRD